MKTRAMIIGEVRTQRYGAAILHLRNHVVQAFTANRTDDTFDVSALPGRPWSAENFFDIHYRHLTAELLTIDSISISQQISRRRIEWEGLQYLLRCPFGGRVTRNIEVDNASSIMCED